MHGGSPWQFINIKKPGVYLKIRKHIATHKNIFSNFEKLTESMEEGDFIALEWPSSCAYLRNKETIACMKHNLKTVKFHGCMLGVVSRKTQTPIKKPWTIATNCEEIIQEFSKFKCDKTHEHAPCAGQDTKLTENYSKPFAAAFHRGFARACQRLEAGEGESHETNHNKTTKTRSFLSLLVALFLASPFLSRPV